MMRSLWLACCLALVATATHAAPLPSAVQLPDFVYQGRLERAGVLVNGTADLVFTLWDAPSGGFQQGATISKDDHPVVGGLFSVTLSYPGQFNGTQLYLEVSVDGTVLPRQPVNTAPVAQYALAGTPGPAGTTGQDAFTVYGTGQLVVGAATTSYTLIPGLSQTLTIPANSVLYISTDGGVQSTGATASTFSVVDIGLFIDGTVVSQGGQRRLSIANTSALAQLIANWNIAVTRTLPAGSHTFQVRAVGGAAGSSNANVSSAAAPQLQGQLTVLVIRK